MTVLAKAAAAGAAVLGGAVLIVGPQAEAHIRQPPLQVTVSRPKVLLPGGTQGLLVSVRNPNNFPIRVTSLDVSVARANRRSCKPTSSNLRVVRAAQVLPVTIPARRSRAGRWVIVTMPGTVSPTCQRSQFTFTVKARAVKAK